MPPTVLSSLSFLRWPHLRVPISSPCKATVPPWQIQNSKTSPTPVIRHHDFHRSISISSPRQDNSSQSSPPIPMKRLKEAACMITGGASGIGFAIAQRFLREGAGKIMLVGRRKERLIDALERLRTENNSSLGLAGQADEVNPVASAARQVENGADGCTELLEVSKSDNHEILASGQFALLVGDVGDPLFWGNEVKKAMENVDILINAAGISHSALLPLAKDQHIAQILATNLQGTIFACRAMTRRALRKQRKPAGSADNSMPAKCIINISSLHATKGGIGASTYASAKAGVIALTRAIAAEGSLSATGTTVRANVVVPGYIDTAMLDEFSESFRAEAEQSIPLKRFGTCEEVADAAAFLATNQYANNCVLNLDGGLSAM